MQNTTKNGLKFSFARHIALVISKACQTNVNTYDASAYISQKIMEEIHRGKNSQNYDQIFCHLALVAVTSLHYKDPKVFKENTLHKKIVSFAYRFLEVLDDISHIKYDDGEVHGKIYYTYLSGQDKVDFFKDRLDKSLEYYQTSTEYDVSKIKLGWFKGTLQKCVSLKSELNYQSETYKESSILLLHQNLISDKTFQNQVLKRLTREEIQNLHVASQPELTESSNDKIVKQIYDSAKFAIRNHAHQLIPNGDYGVTVQKTYQDLKNKMSSDKKLKIILTCIHFVETNSSLFGFEKKKKDKKDGEDDQEMENEDSQDADMDIVFFKDFIK